MSIQNEINMLSAHHIFQQIDENHLKMDIDTENDKIKLIRSALKKGLKEFLNQNQKEIQLKDENYQVEPKMNNSNQISKNTEETQTCLICLEEKKKDHFFSLCDCQHSFCSRCLELHTYQKMGRYQQVKCPNLECPKIISKYSHTFTQLPNHFQQKYMKIHNFLSLSFNPNVKVCPNQNCIEGTLSFTTKQSQLKCTHCFQHFCSTCLLKPHKGMCQTVNTRYLKKQFKYRQCSNCLRVVEKNEGCIHITCLCKHQFCYICGGKWDNQHSRECKLPDWDELSIFGKIRHSLAPSKIKKYMKEKFSFTKLRKIANEYRTVQILIILLKLFILLPIFLMIAMIRFIAIFFVFLIAILVNFLILGPRQGYHGFSGLTRSQKIAHVVLFPIPVFQGIADRMSHVWDAMKRNFKELLDGNVRCWDYLLFW